MQIVFGSRAGERDLDVDVRDPNATLVDVLRALGEEPIPETLLVDGRPVPGATPLLESGLHEGALLAAGDADGYAGAAGSADLILAVLTGPDAGRTYPLPVGRSTVGRVEGNSVPLGDATVSREHCEIQVESDGTIQVQDLGSANGTSIDGVRLVPGEPTTLEREALLEVGDLCLAVRDQPVADRPRSLDLRQHVGPAGTVSFNRPPRPAAPAPPNPVSLPVEPAKSNKPPFNIATTVGPLVLAVVMVAVTRDLRYALFSLLSPLLALFTYLESRRKNSIGNRKEQRRYDKELDTLRADVAAAAQIERARRRGMSNDLAEVLRRAARPSVRLWERRPDDEDFLRLHVGVADVAWRPAIPDSVRSREVPEKVGETLEAGRLIGAPITVDLAEGVVGIAGDRTAALALARGLLCQAAVHHGPADLTVGVFADSGARADWDWSKWLPHTHGAAGTRWLATEWEQSERLLQALAGRNEQGALLVVLDSHRLVEGKRAPARDLLQKATPPPPTIGQTEPRQLVTGIVVASSADRLPAVCTTILEVDASGAVTVQEVDEGSLTRDIRIAGLSVETARRCARDLARFDDPELRQEGAGLPGMQRLLPLLDLDPVSVEHIRRRWRQGDRSSDLVLPLGMGEHGVFALDLVRDGPHGLIGGTTGSGKSELLRSLVAALAVACDPAHLTFALIDFKGGATFDACAGLPHTVGMVTDLDEEAADEETLRSLRRVLRSLEAELQHRERLLRSARADNLREYVARGPEEPLPRLLVIIDEFGAMAEKIGDQREEFLSSLISVAQRGRTLGVHMILAAQRPSGVVNDKIRANTNLRIALRVQDAEDSLDVIGQRDAAQLSREHPGRAYVRLGPGEVVEIQTALVTAVSGGAKGPAVQVASFEFGPVSSGPSITDTGQALSEVDDEQPTKTDLVLLVEAVHDANRAEGIAPPRKLWPDPLPEQLDLAQLRGAQLRGAQLRGAQLSAAAADPGEPQAVVALADNPARQAQYPVGWQLADGNLLLLGVPGSGTTTALTSLALSLAGAMTPAELEVYVFDFGAGDLAVLERLPQTGSVIPANDRERQMRLVRHLAAELNRRRSGTAAGADRRIVVLLDNLSAMRAEFDDTEGLDLMDLLTRVYADGPETGISFAVAADRLGTVPTAWLAVTTQRWLFQLGDSYDYVAAGLGRSELPATLPGRAVMSSAGLPIQVGRPMPSATDVADELAARYEGTPRLAAPIRALPAEVSLDSLGAVAEIGGEPWRIPFGVRESDLGVAELVLYEGEHALVAGPARSGKSSTLLTLAQSLRAGQPEGGLFVGGTGGRRSPLRDSPLLDRYAAGEDEAVPLFAHLHTVTGPAVLLIDDAEGFEDVDGAIAGLLAANLPQLHVIAAGNADSLRSLYGHWTQTVRKAKVGVLLRPNIDYDGDLLGVTLPRRTPVPMVQGRGYVGLSGELSIVQVARADQSRVP